MTRRNVAVAAAAIVVALPAGALAQLGGSPRATREGLPSQERYRLRLEYREWRPDLTGTMLKASRDADGTVVDLNDALKGDKEWAKTKSELLPSNVDGCSWKGKFVMNDRKKINASESLNLRVIG